MSVLIKGMEMPSSCDECRLYNDPWCMAKNKNQWRTAYNRPPKGERQNDCPLVPAADVRPVVVCADCKHNNACLTQAFVEDESKVPFDRNTFFCADGKRADDA